MSIRAKQIVLVVPLLVAAPAGCTDALMEGRRSGPGELVLELVSPTAGDAAFTMEIRGEVKGVKAEPGFTVFQRDGDGGAEIILLADAALMRDEPKAVARVSVPDVGRAESYEVRITAAASIDREPRGTLDGYRGKLR